MRMTENLVRKWSGGVLEKGVDFLKAAMSLDGFWALRVGTHQLMKNSAGHSRVLLFEMRIPYLQ